MTTETAKPPRGDFGHSQCILCGEYNPSSLKLSFASDGEGGVFSSFRADPVLQGYDNMLHGGVISSLLDAAMTHCLFHRGVKAVTEELKVRFREPVPCEAMLELRARLGRTMAKAEAKFIRVTPGE